jgi:uncharacterized protein YoaH (UPF0181 family)
MKGRKADAATAAQRVERVYRLLLDGYSTGQIVHFAAQSWHINARQAKTYIARAREQIASDAITERKEALDLAVMTLRELYRQAFAARKYSAAAAILDQQARLLGLYPATRNAVQGELCIRVVYGDACDTC